MRAELARLLPRDAGPGRQLVAFLANAYRFKELADYSVGELAVVTVEQARILIADARGFIETVNRLLDRTP